MLSWSNVKYCVDILCAGVTAALPYPPPGRDPCKLLEVLLCHMQCWKWCNSNDFWVTIVVI